MEELHPDNMIRVEGVITHEWIPFLNAWGPLNRCSLKVKDIVNLLNNDINVVLTEDKNEQLYFFVKNYNLYAERFSKPTAARAEAVLYERVYKEAIRIEENEDKENPFLLDPSQEQEIDTILDSVIVAKPKTDMVSPLKQKSIQQVKRPKMYDMLKTSERTKTSLQKMEEMQEDIKYGDIAFDN